MIRNSLVYCVHSASVFRNTLVQGYDVHVPLSCALYFVYSITSNAALHVYWIELLNFRFKFIYIHASLFDRVVGVGPGH